MPGPPRQPCPRAFASRSRLVRARSLACEHPRVATPCKEGAARGRRLGYPATPWSPPTDDQSFRSRRLARSTNIRHALSKDVGSVHRNHRILQGGSTAERSGIDVSPEYDRKHRTRMIEFRRLLSSSQPLASSPASFFAAIFAGSISPAADRIPDRILCTIPPSALERPWRIVFRIPARPHHVLAAFHLAGCGCLS